MLDFIQPPAPQAMQRRLWLDLEFRYWVYLASAVLTCVLDFILGPGAWWQKGLCCGVVLLLAALPGARWGGVHLDTLLWWEGRHFLHLLCVAGERRRARLWADLCQRVGKATTRPPDPGAWAAAERRDARSGQVAMPWWQETAWEVLEGEEPLAAAEDADWGVPAGPPAWDEVDEEGWAEEQDCASETPFPGEDDLAPGWVDDWVGTGRGAALQGWVDDWASHPIIHPQHQQEEEMSGQQVGLMPLRAPPGPLLAAGLAWDTVTADAYDPHALFLLDQSPRFQHAAPLPAGRILAWHEEDSTWRWSSRAALEKGA
jgi:hypothetical protein